MKVKITAPGVTHGAQIVKVGDVIDLAEASADALVEANLAEYAEDEEERVPEELFTLENLTVDQLKVIAEKAGIAGFEFMEKADLVAAIEAKLAAATEDPVTEDPTLDKMTVDQLKAIADKEGVEGYKSMKKADLVAAIEAKLAAKEDRQGAV